MNDYPGHNSRLDELQAAILLAKLPRLNAENQYRRMLAQQYLNGIQHPDIILPSANQIEQDAWHLFVIRHPRRDALRAYLHKQGIGTDVHYPIPPHQQGAYKEWKHHSLPISEQLHREVLSLPLNTALSPANVAYIVEAINQFESQ